MTVPPAGLMIIEAELPSELRMKHLRCKHQKYETLLATKSFNVSLLLRVKGVQLGFLIISQAGGVAMTIPPSRLMVAETEL